MVLAVMEKLRRFCT